MVVERGAVSTLRLVPQIAADIAEFEAALGRFQRGEMGRDEFRAFRTLRGIYGQRQAERYMVRVKIPYGGLTAAQLERLGEIAERYSRGFGHVTTRQNIQFHFVLLDMVPEVMRQLGEVGLATREAGGNTVRNVTACALAGVCPKELFDVSPYAAAASQHFLRCPLVQRLPRKVKIAFSGCPADCAFTQIHDIGAVAALQESNGATQRGFRLVVGGGLGTIPRLAQVLHEFLPANELVPTCEAVVRVFERLGERGNRNRARMKFLLQKVGIEEFRRLVQEARASLPPGAAPWPDIANGHEPTPSVGFAQGEEGGCQAGFERWRSANVVAQWQPGYYAAFVNLPLGDITAAQFRALAAIARQFAGGYARTTSQQALVLRWVPEEHLPALYAALSEAGLGLPGAEGIGDVTACPGTDTCMSALTSSRGLGRRLAELFRDGDAEPALAGISIKVSGCPNACGQHHLGTIGLQGCALHYNGHLYPAYQLLLGGGVYEGQARLAQPIVKIPAKQVPAAIAALLQLYRQQRRPEESFVPFLDRVGEEKIQAALAAFAAVPSPAEDPEVYIDWEALKPFSLDERGEGECAV